MDKVIVVLPAYNEEKTVGKVIDEIRLLGLGYDILVVDNNSTDKTAEIAKARGVQYLFVKEQGKGCAISKGFKSVSGTTVIMDSDYTYPAAYIPALVGSLKEYDVVLGWRKYKDPGAMTSTNSIGNYLLTKLANLLYGTHIHDVCTGMWAFRDVRPLVIESKGFTLEPEMLIQARRYGWKIGEVSIHYRAREGTSKLNILDGFKIGAYLLRERFR